MAMVPERTKSGYIRYRFESDPVYIDTLIIDRRSFLKSVGAATIATPILLTQAACSDSELSDFKTTFDAINIALTGAKPAVDALSANGQIGAKEAAAFNQIQAIIAKDNPTIQAITQWPPANAQQIYNDLFPLIQSIQAALVDPASHPVLTVVLSTAEALIQELLNRLEPAAATSPSVAPQGARAPRTSTQSWTPMTHQQLKSKTDELKARIKELRKTAGK